jgi:hypothetical protein
MIKKEQKIDELLSAYIDGELSPEEIERLNIKIKSSLELQKKLEDLKKIKEIISNNYQGISESPYFETRLFAELKSQKPWYRKALKWSPAVGLALTTILLMIVLKFNPQVIDNLIEQQTSNIAGFYKENLQPLLFAADLNNEDIFNFAMYKQLPLNKENNQILHLGRDASGKEYFEIKDVDKIVNENNYEKFVSALDLNEIQKLQIDSIINEYAAELEAQILVNVDNTVAINSNLWNYQRAIQSDLIAFAEKSNELQFHKLMPGTRSFTNSLTVIKTVNDLRKTKNKNYIILTPDSIFAEAIEFEPDAYVRSVKDYNRMNNDNYKHLKNIKINFKYDSSWKRPDKQTGWQHHINILIDSNRCRVDISQLDIPDINIPDFDSIFSSFDSIANNFRFYSRYIPQVEYFDNKIKFEFNSDSIKSYQFNFHDFDMDSLMNSQFNMIDSMKNFNFQNFFDFSDSIVFKGFPGFNNYYNQGELGRQMEELKKEMEKFRKEMMEYRNEFRNQGSSRKKYN